MIEHRKRILYCLPVHMLSNKMFKVYERRFVKDSYIFPWNVSTELLKTNIKLAIS